MSACSRSEMCAAAMAARQVREQRAAKEPDESWSQEQLDIFEMTRTSSSREFKVLGPHTSVDNNGVADPHSFSQTNFRLRNLQATLS